MARAVGRGRRARWRPLAGEVTAQRFRAVVPYLYVLPALAPMVLFLYWPLLYSLALSFFAWNFTRPAWTFVGSQNYTDMLENEVFWISAANTGWYLVGLLPFEILLPLALAVLLTSLGGGRLQTIYKVLIFSPTVLSFAIACLVWLWIFNPLGGLMNLLIARFDLGPVSWLSDKAWALWSIVLVSGWKVLGYNLVIFMAGLASIPPEYIEAARIDGASRWQVFAHITWPLLTPTTYFVLVTSSLFAATQVFIPIHILTEGGPHDSTSNLIYLIYLQGFHFFTAGAASATAVVTFGVFLLLTLIQTKYVERRVHYET